MNEVLAEVRKALKDCAKSFETEIGALTKFVSRLVKLVGKFTKG